MAKVTYKIRKRGKEYHIMNGSNRISVICRSQRMANKVLEALELHENARKAPKRLRVGVISWPI